MGEQCPLLEDLAITINRTQGGFEELESYAALGSLQNLKYLDLVYEVTPTGLLHGPREAITSSARNFSFKNNELPGISSFDEFENQIFKAASRHVRLRNGHVQRLIVDSVIDEKLACAVFKAISDAKLPGSPLFKDLTVTACGASCGYDTERIVDTFTSSWRVMRDPHSHSRENLIAEEIQPHRDLGGRYCHLPPWVEPIFYRLFPAGKPKAPPRKESKKLATKREEEKSQTVPMWRRYLHGFRLASDTDH
ncbi:uncharacterized protein N7482_006126 [Penicillium canariense]|uniref:Uncharacterized protein n=1 Tax=Penicillium canariense TaxID=189055 RepID=A0A9W9I669_9EURO|nr:uncharacterized protein N7482_006126 [Penicillium canariense]KAJ5167345.1 hypothetical protein N7482_006126 [Penicillium canariense]